MDRRSFLTAAGVPIAGLGVGCLGTGIEGADDDNGESDDPDDGADETVAYDELPDYDQRFVDATKEYHSVYWITEDDERIVIESTDDGWVEVNDPLVKDEVHDELQDVISGEKALEIDGDHYTFAMDVGHGPYGQTISATTIDDCGGEEVDLDEFPEREQELLQRLLEEREVMVAEPGFEAVSNADYFFPPGEETEFGQKLLVGDDCLLADGEIYGLELETQHILDSEGYELTRAES